eukprot:CAMPEP_0176449188 /NCGR_PEP_ID=MMETSP0127-20121128/26293_1 /TAXON_ID=938130 /ORGANISM="Platyophrya macrostoma, Strain WH" /LENGTH=160 /DNA_ID=CAMNT_0017836407 /DNA_START=12 /DNA_END=494 /DNA_ORIENTATION=+
MKAWEVKLVKAKPDVPDPLGFTKNLNDVSEGEARPTQLRDIMENKVKTFAMAPAGQILMALLMLYMSGGGLNIFMIFFTFQVLVQPIKALVGINGAFKQFEGYKIPLLPYKLMYAAIQSVILSIGGYRLYTMGLLPLAPADWVDLIPRRSSPIASFAIMN